MLSIAKCRDLNYYEREVIDGQRVAIALRETCCLDHLPTPKQLTFTP